MDGPAKAANTVAAPLIKRPTWEQAEGNPLPLGVNWIEKEQAFNFAVHSEHADSVTLLFYSPADLVNPLLRLPLDFLHNKSGRIWHCRVPVSKIARLVITHTPSRERPFLNSIVSTRRRFSSIPTRSAFSFPPGFDRNLAMREGSNAGRAPLGVLIDHRPTFDWSGDRSSAS